MKYLPYVPLALAIIVALTVADTGTQARRELATGWIALLIGLSLALSGVKAMTFGRVLLRTRHAGRDAQPAAFWTAVVLFRFGLGALFLVYGVWMLI